MVWEIEFSIGQTPAISLTAIREVGGKPSAVNLDGSAFLCELNAER
jgi:hypothetical protein